MMNSKKALQQLKKIEKQSSTPRLAAENWDKEWKTLIATILSAQTRDETTIPICEKLFKQYPSLKKLSEAKLEHIKSIIRPINFYKNKSKNIINCAKELVLKYNSKIPQEIEELIKLPGVGRKTANVYLSEHGKPAIGVDTHVARISKKLNWTKNTIPDKIEEDLKSLFPKKYWVGVNPTLVKFGKSHTNKEEDEILKEIKKL